MTDSCPRCGGTLTGGPRFCPSCGKEVAPRRGRGRWPWAVGISAAVAVAAAAAAALLTTGGEREAGAPAGERPSPLELPAGVVAVVTQVDAELGTVTRRDYDRALDQAAAQSGLKRPPRPGHRQYRQVREAALESLLDSIWIQGQAAAMGIGVGDREVARELRKLKRENFENEAEYREFLDEAEFTQGDVDERVRLQLLASEIQSRIAANARGRSRGGKRRAAQGAFQEFIERYTQRWRSRTVCAPAFAFERCSNGPAPDRAEEVGSPHG